MLLTARRAHHMIDNVGSRSEAGFSRRCRCPALIRNLATIGIHIETARWWRSRGIPRR